MKMTYKDSGLWIVSNAEVFNFIELRQDLESLGYHFVSASDTEVILASYLAWGRDSFSKFNGIGRSAGSPSGAPLSAHAAMAASSSSLREGSYW